VNDDPGLEQRLERLEAEVAELQDKLAEQRHELDELTALYGDMRITLCAIELRLACYGFCL
jgi:prefoldin subunit 5